MIYELYIDGSRVDLGDSQITLNYKSGVMTDFNNIIGNTSYSITLPKTSRNMAAFKGLGVITCDWQETNLTAELRQNGIVIIDDAKVYITSISDNIEIILLWGIRKNVSVNLSKKLDELSFDWQDPNTYVKWYYISRRDRPALYGVKRYPLMDYGQGKSRTLQPALTLKELVDIISQKVEIQYPDDVLADMENKVVPLLQNKSCEAYEDHAIIEYPTSKFYLGMSSSWQWVWRDSQDAEKQYLLLNIEPSTNSIFNEFFTYDNWRHKKDGVESNARMYRAKYPNIDIEINIKGYMKITAQDFVDGISYPIFAVLGSKEYDKLTNIGSSEPTEYFEYEETAEQLVRDYHFAIDQSFTVTSLPYSNEQDYQTHDIPTNLWGIFVEMHTRSTRYLECDLTIEIKPKFKTIYPPLGQRYYFIPNLPSLQVGEFLEAISYIYGLTAEYKDGAIRYGRAVNNQDSNIYSDWSNLLYRSRDAAPKDISYTTSGYSRFNKFVLSKYDKIKLDLEYNYEFSIDTSDDEETTEIDTHLSLCGNDGKAFVGRTFDPSSGQPIFAWQDTARIPIYSLNSNLEYDFEAYDGLFVLDLELYGKTTDRYRALQKISIGQMIEEQRSTWLSAMKKYTAITEIFKLPPIVLKELDMTIPVFLKQYGSYFMIDEITTQENNLAEVKLIKLN